MARDDAGRFILGGKGGPGRPKGSRNKLAEAFLADLCEDWAQHGPATLAAARESAPAAYAAMVARLLPTQVEPSDRFARMTEEEVDARLRAVLAELGVELLG